jgi:hypothetical protein
VRMAARRPHLVVLTEIHVDDRADGGRVTQRSDAACGPRFPT